MKNVVEIICMPLMAAAWGIGYVGFVLVSVLSISVNKREQDEAQILV